MESNNSMYSPESQPVVQRETPEPIKDSLEAAPLSEKDKENIRAEFEALDENNDTKSLYIRWKKDFEMLEETDEEAFLRAVQKRLKQRHDILNPPAYKYTLPTHPPSQEVVDEMNQTLSDFEVLQNNEYCFLGSGQYARVYVDSKSSRVAVKYLYDEYQTKLHKELIERECQFMEELWDFRVQDIRAPYIYGKDGVTKKPAHYLVMERIHGFSLRDIVETKKAGEEFVALLKSIDEKVLHEKLTEFLQEMHEVKKIVHGDIHAGNIMIDGDGNIFLIDFGKSKKTDTVSSDNEAITDKMEADEKLAYEGTTTMGESKKREFEELTKTLQAVYQTLLTM